MEVCVRDSPVARPDGAMAASMSKEISVNIFVGNLSYRTDENELRKLFAQFGNVSRANIIMDRETGQSRGFAFVQMATHDQAQAAIAKLNGLEFAGRPIIVNEAKPRESNGNRRFGPDAGNQGNGNYREPRGRRNW
jgi:cold-inducible RNA-binding protein